MCYFKNDFANDTIGKMNHFLEKGLKRDMRGKAHNGALLDLKYSRTTSQVTTGNSVPPQTSFLVGYMLSRMLALSECIDGRFPATLGQDVASM